MRSKDKPYRVYRGGRARGQIGPLPPIEPEAAPLAEDGGGGYSILAPELPAPETPPRERPRRRRRRLRLRGLRWILPGLVVVVLAFTGWGAAGYFALRHGIADANRRLPVSAVAALTPQEGSLLSSPANILLLGTDQGPGREGPGRTDAIVLVHTDPDHHRIALLTIPRDLRVEIADHGQDKVNAAYAYGGAALAIETVERLTGLPVNHVAVVDFGRFGQLIDALGGVTIDIPNRIVSNHFDCPYATKAECERWPGWRFEPGRHTLDGRRALVYARIRENRLDPSETDVTRGARQQQVIQAIADEVVGFHGFLRLPFIGDDVAKPLATDLSTSELLELGWVKFRASPASTLRCRLGGAAEEIAGVWYLEGTEENVSVLAMVAGESAPQPPPPNAGAYAPGCRVGK